MAANTVIVGRVAIKVMPDTSEFRKDAERELNVVEKAMKDITVMVTPDLSGPAMIAASARLAILARPRQVQLFPKVDNAAAASAALALTRLSGARLISSYFESIARSILRLDKSAPIIGTLALATAGLAGFGLSAASNLFALSSSLASIAPTALALPGILGGIAIGVGVMIAALKDFGAVFPDVAGQFSAMQDVISNNFWARATVPMREMIDSLLPQLADGFARTATELGGYFGALSTALNGSLDGALSGMFADLSASIAVATTGTGALAGIVRTLGEVGAGYLPRLAQWFVDISTSFDRFLSGAASDGRLRGWVDTGIVAINDLGNVLGSLGGIFAGLARAATDAGGSSLAMLAETLERVSNAVNSEGFQTGLVSVLTAAHAAMQLIADTSGPAVSNLFEQLGVTLTAVLPLAGQAIATLLTTVATALANPVLSTGVLALFDGIRLAIESLAPAVPVVAVALGSLFTVLGDFLASVAPAVAAAFVALSTLLVALAPTISVLVTALAGGLTVALQTVATAVIALTGFLSEHTTIATILSVAVGTVLVAALTAYGIAATVNAATSVAAWIAAAVTGQASAGKQSLSAGQVVAGWVLMAAQATINAAKVVASWVASAVAAAANAALHVAAYALIAASAVASAARTAAAWVAANVALVASTVATVAAVVAAWVLMGVQALLAAAKVAAAWLIAMGPIGLVIVAVVALVALIIANWDTIKRVTQQLWEAVQRATAAAWEWIKSAVSSAIGFVTTLFLNFTGPGLIIKHWETIKSAFSNGVNAVVGFVSGLPGKIANAFGNAGSILINAGRAVIDGLLSGITSGFRKVRDKLSELTSLLPDWKGPAKRDSLLLVNAGELIIGGLIVGMESRYAEVRKSLSGLTSDIGGVNVAAPQVTGTTAAGRRLAGLASSAYDGEGGSKTFIYNAAPGASLGSEEELFMATGRARMVGF